MFSDDVQEPPSSLDHESRSRFTYRDLKNLSRYATNCPLRIIVLIDFDAFYAQCEIVRLGLPADQPLVVQQFTAVIASNYPAKAAGLKRITSVEEAKVKCPNVYVQHVATWREGDANWAYRPDVKQDMATDKAALDPYRKQSRKAFELIKSLLPASPLQKVEKASIDEVFVDLSAHVHTILLERYPHLSSDLAERDPEASLPRPPTTVLDWDEDKLVVADTSAENDYPDWDDVALNIGSEIVRRIRAEIYTQMKYTCSAGLARNKTVAKLAAGHNKPNGQTIVRARAIANFYSEYKLTKIRGLGGKLGHKVVEACGTEQMADLLKFSLEDLRSKIGAESGSWVYHVIRGIDHSEVVERTQLQSMLAQKTFVPKAKDMEQLDKWLRIFAGDIIGRLEEQDATSAHRRPKVVAMHQAYVSRYGPRHSKQMQIPPGARITAELLFDLFKDLLIQISHDSPLFPCIGLSVSVSNFEDQSAGNRNLSSFFSRKIAETSPQNVPSEQRVVPRSSKPAPDGISKRKRGLLDFDGFGKAPAVKRTQSNGTDHEPNGQSTTTPHDTEVSTSSGMTKDLVAGRDGYSCPKCKKHIVDVEVLEHLDWHVAMELQGS